MTPSGHYRNIANCCSFDNTFEVVKRGLDTATVPSPFLLLLKIDLDGLQVAVAA